MKYPNKNFFFFSKREEKLGRGLLRDPFFFFSRRKKLLGEARHGTSHGDLDKRKRIKGEMIQIESAKVSKGGCYFYV